MIFEVCFETRGGGGCPAKMEKSPAKSGILSCKEKYFRLASTNIIL